MLQLVAEVPLFDQGSVQFILLTVMILIVGVPGLAHDPALTSRGRSSAPRCS